MSFDAVPAEPIVWEQSGLRISIRRRSDMLAAMVVRQNGEC
jgi:hypothetical protein